MSKNKARTLAKVGFPPQVAGGATEVCVLPLVLFSLSLSLGPSPGALFPLTGDDGPPPRSLSLCSMKQRFGEKKQEQLAK